MEFQNLRIFQPDGSFVPGGLTIEGDRISAAAPSADAPDMGGLYAVGRAGRPALAVGLGTGITLFLLLLCVGLLAYDAAGLERDGAGTLCACLCGGGLAGVLALPRKKKRRR